MIIQKSSTYKNSILYLIPTPIGNLGDMTSRAIEVLSSVDFVYAEDTRVTKVMLSHFNINANLRSYHSFNEEIAAAEILAHLSSGANIALVSDAGMPGVSDPGYFITRLALDNNFPVISLPGASASLTALVASGIASDKFYFYGFLKHKSSQKKQELEALVDFKNTLIFYEAPTRIIKTLNIMYEVFGNREVVIARELTKKFEEYLRTTLEEVQTMELTLKGEFVIVVSGAKEAKLTRELNALSILEHYNYYLSTGLSHNESLKEVARDRKVSKSIIYKEIEETKNPS